MGFGSFFCFERGSINVLLENKDKSMPLKQQSWVSSVNLIKFTIIMMNCITNRITTCYNSSFKLNSRFLK